MKQVFVALMLIGAFAQPLLALPIGNDRYLKDGQLNTKFVGELVSLKGRLASRVVGPRNFLLVKIILPEAPTSYVWASNLSGSTDPKDIFQLGDEVGVLGYLTDDHDAGAVQITGSKPYVLGLCFFNFRTTESVSFNDAQCDEYQNYNKTFVQSEIERLRESADRGDPVSLNSLGNRYMHGTGVAKDFGAAIKYYEKAAAKGVAVAKTNLGAMYDSGLGVAEDKEKAIALYSEAANALEAGAMLNLGILYASGYNGRQGLITGYMWIELAKRHAGKVQNFRVVSSANIALQRLDGYISEEQISDALERADAWLPTEQLE